MAPDRFAPLPEVPLAPHTTLGVGGAARWYFRARTIEAARDAVRWAGQERLPLLVLGGGSNLVVADAGWPGLVLHVAMAGIAFSGDDAGERLSAGAGESWDAVVAAAVGKQLAGLECLSGIPGTVGGTPVQNVGAYGQEVGAVIDRVDVLDTADGAARALAAADCGFAYRMSRFKGVDAGRFIVCGVSFRLRQAAPTIAYPDVMAYLDQHAIMSPGVADVRRAVLEIRRRKGMVLDANDVDTRSVGSFFMNPVVPAALHRDLSAGGTVVPSFPAGHGQVKVPAAWLIERAGIGRGFAMGAAAVSSKHPLALVNRGGATAREIVTLAVHVKRTVARHFGIALRPEPIFVGFEADAEVAYLQEAQG